MIHQVECDLGGQPLVIETGRVAKQADGSAVVRYGDTMVLVTAVSTTDVRPGIDFFPLTCDYQEFYWAAGRVPGNFFRREVGRPSTKETLTSRMIDRPLRPRFPEGYAFETQIIANVLSCDAENDADVLAMVGASAALSVSDIPWQGPIAACRVGRVDGEFVMNPTKTELEGSDMNIIVAASKEAIVMVEGETDFVSEEDISEALFAAQKALAPVIEIQEKLAELVGNAKREFTAPAPDTELEEKVVALATDRMNEAIRIAEKMPRYRRIDAVKAEVVAEMGEDYAPRAKEIKAIIGELKAKLIREMILTTGKRIDGRDLTTVRPITCDVGVLPRAHGSALFTRGETQALVTTTLGTAGDEQRIESIMGDSLKSFFLHYNFPPFSVGEAKRLGGPNRRETGHGNLAERALKNIVPEKEDFFYTIRVVSDILESNGSSSMASVCGGSLSLMDAGVPTSQHIAGVAMGLIQEGDKTAVLTDILGDEDHVGDMDFKVTGSKEGVTAIQMDIKVPELSKEIMTQALFQARDGRLHILDIMEQAIPSPRGSVSDWAPRVVTVQIRPEKIRDIIGPGGKVIKAMQAETGCRVDVEDSGKVLISSSDPVAIEQCVDIVKSITKEVEVGEIYEGEVKRITDFGAFVEVLPGTDGLVHISELEHHRVERVTDVLHEGDVVKVKVLDVDHNGKIRLSRKALLERPEGMPERPEREERNGGGDRRGGRDNRRPRGRR